MDAARDDLAPGADPDCPQDFAPGALEYVALGHRSTGWIGGSLTVTTWGPKRTEPEILRRSYAFPQSHSSLRDKALQAVIDDAKKWIGGRRMSWSVVACNYLWHQDE